MKLSSKDFKRFKMLEAKVKDGSISEDEKKEFAKLVAMRAQGTGGNDVEWWKKYALIDDATNFPFNYIKGTKFKDEPPLADPSSASAYNNFRNANGVRLTYLRCPGATESSDSAFNYQNRALWIQMHRKYRGMGGYEWADLGITQFAIANVFADVARAERVYGVANYFSILNRSIPDQVMAALGVVIETSRLASFRYRLNRLILKAQTLCLPKGLSILDSWLSLDGFIFKDADSERACWYLYDTDVRWSYSSTGFSTGGACYTKERTRSITGSWGERAQTFDDILSDLEEQVDNLLHDSDVTRICTDLIAMFKDKIDSEVMTLKALPEEWSVKPVRDDTRLMQLHNTTLCGQVCSIDTPYDIALELDAIHGSNYVGGTPLVSIADYNRCIVLYQRPGEGAFFKLGTTGDLDGCYMNYTGTTPKDVTWVGSSAEHLIGGTKKVILDIWKDSVSNDDKIEMTRQTVSKSLYRKTSVVDYEGSLSFSKGCLRLESFGNIVVKFMDVFFGDKEDIPPVRVPNDYITGGSSGLTNADVSGVVPFLSQLDWSPRIGFIDILGPNVPSKIMTVWDIDNIAECNHTTLFQLHDAAMLSAWRIGAQEILENSK